MAKDASWINMGLVSWIKALLGRSDAQHIMLAHAGVAFTVLDGPYQSAGKPTSAAQVFAASIVDRLEDYKMFACDHLLDLYNETWLAEEIGTLDASSFMQRLTKPSVTLYDELGAAAIYFGDGDMFGGHYVEVW